jgi:hypothetical protein
MTVLQIVLTICTIGMFILSLALVRFVYLRSKKLFTKKSIKPSLIDKMLFFERSPFAWRIGFAYSLLGYNQDQIDKFNHALQKIIMVEKNMYHLNKRVNHDVETVSQIKKYTELLTASSIFNDANPEDELPVILSQEIDKFIDETARSLRQEKMNSMEFPPDEPPF